MHACVLGVLMMVCGCGDDDGVCVCDEVMVTMVVDDERGIIVYSCPVARMVGILASRSPFFAAL